MAKQNNIGKTKQHWQNKTTLAKQISTLMSTNQYFEYKIKSEKIKCKVLYDEIDDLQKEIDKKKEKIKFHQAIIKNLSCPLYKTLFTVALPYNDGLIKLCMAYIGNSYCVDHKFVFTHSSCPHCIPCKIDIYTKVFIYESPYSWRAVVAVLDGENKIGYLPEIENEEDSIFFQTLLEIERYRLISSPAIQFVENVGRCAFFPYRSSTYLLWDKYRYEPIRLKFKYTLSNGNKLAYTIQYATPEVDWTF